jgi:hypothetical protein
MAFRTSIFGGGGDLQEDNVRQAGGALADGARRIAGALIPGGTAMQAASAMSSAQADTPPITGAINRGAPPPIAPPGAQQQSTPAMGAPAADDIDPEVGYKIARESAEAARKTPEEDKKAITDELEATFGKGTVEEAYKRVLESIQSTRGRPIDDEDEDTGFSFKGMSREEKGLFLMDFGMRMMAHSGQGEALGASIGMAGSAALGGVMDREAAARERRAAQSEAALEQERHDEQLAMDITKMGMDKRRDEPLEGEQGYFDRGTGDYVRDPQGNIVKPPAFGGRYGSSGPRPGAKQQMAMALMEAGWSQEAAWQLANDAPMPARVGHLAQVEFGKMLAKAGEGGGFGKIQAADGSWRRVKDMSEEEIAAAEQAFVQRRMTGYDALLKRGAAAGGGALPPEEARYEDEALADEIDSEWEY